MLTDSQISAMLRAVIKLMLSTANFNPRERVTCGVNPVFTGGVYL